MTHKGSHIREDGSLGPCKAKPGNCPIKKTDLGEPFHGTSEEVSAEIERRNKEIHGTLGAGLSKSAKWFHIDANGNPVVCREDGNCDPELKHEQLKHEPTVEQFDSNGRQFWKNSKRTPKYGPTAAQFNDADKWWKNSKPTG